MGHAITFETKCYEGDWQFLLRKNRLEQMIYNCHFPFDEKVLFINNVSDFKTVKKAADKLIAKGVITAYHVVEDYAEQTLKEFNIAKASFKGGYYYSIAELVSIRLCKTDYLLHFSGDALLEPNGKPWIEDAMLHLDNDPLILAANPTWDFKYNEAKTESFKEDENWYYSLGGFSDQSYLINPERFRKDIYNETHPFSARYPEYGGELFEKRIDAYMRNNSLQRITSKHVSYVHQNFPKDKLRRFISLYLKA